MATFVNSKIGARLPGASLTTESYQEGKLEHRIRQYKKNLLARTVGTVQYLQQMLSLVTAT